MKTFELNTNLVRRGRKITHGLYNTRLNNIWSGIKQRCYNPKCQAFMYYGKRGIIICDEWYSDFKAFYDWSMKNGYRQGLTIDRIDNNGNYEPSNCRWTTMAVQDRNKRNKRDS